MAALALAVTPLSAAELTVLQARIATLREAVQAQSANPLASGRPTLRLQISTGVEQHVLLLTPNETLGPWAARLQPRATAFEGQLANLPGSWARLTRVGSTWIGLWFDGASYYGIDTARSLAGATAVAAAADPEAQVVFRLADARLADAGFAGDMRSPVLDGDELAAAGDPSTAAGVLATRRLTVALIADAELVTQDGAATESNLLARLNIVDGIFSGQLGIRIQAGSTTLPGTAALPFNSNDASTLLEQLRDYRSASATQQAAGLSHLMTGRNLDGQTVGIAYLESVCSNRFSASVSEARSGVTFSALIAAHEIGHLFGAPHDGETDSACADTPQTFLMAPQLNGSSTFSACSLEKMAPVVARAQCLAPVDAADAALGAPLNADLAQDQATPVVVTVRSDGTIPVNGVLLDVTLPGGVQAMGATVTGGSCSIAGSQINCSLGSLAPGVTREARLDLLGSIAGNRSASLQLRADNDGLADNDRASMLLRVAPGADLSVSLAANPASVVVGSDTTAVIEVRNLGLAATADAQLTVSIPAHLALTGVMATNISCTLVTGAASCTPSSLSAGANASVTLALHAAAAGSAALGAGISSSRTDPQAGNNQAQLTIAATSPPPPPPPPPPAGSGKSGGGFAGAELLLMLWLLALRCCARARQRVLAK